MDTTEAAKKVISAYGDADLNQLLKSLKLLDRIDAAATLEYVQILEKGVEQLKIFAVKKASETYMTSSEMAKHLGVSRQTFSNQMKNTIEKHRAEKKAKPNAFANRLGETDRFVDGRLTKASKQLTPAAYKDMDAEGKMYFRSFCTILNAQLYKENAEGVEELFADALKDGVISPTSLRDIQQRAAAFLDKEYDYDELGEPATFTKAEHQWARLHALYNICGLTSEQKKLLAKAKVKMMKEQEELEKQRDFHGDPFALFGLTNPTPAASKLPDNLAEEWENYQASEKEAGRKPTREKFAKRYGVSRATFSRALKRAEAEQNAQK